MGNPMPPMPAQIPVPVAQAIPLPVLTRDSYNSQSLGRSLNGNVKQVRTFRDHENNLPVAFVPTRLPGNQSTSEDDEKRPPGLRLPGAGSFKYSISSAPPNSNPDHFPSSARNQQSWLPS